MNVCYNGLFNDDFEMIAGNCILSPDGVRNSKRVASVIECKYDPKGMSTKPRAIEFCTAAPVSCDDTLKKRVEEMGKLPKYMKEPRKRKTSS